MDIKQRIVDIIESKGLTKKVVCERMGKFDQAFNSLLNNPKWSTLEAVADAIGIDVWQLFEPEIKAAGYCSTLAAPQEAKQEVGTANEIGMITEELPFTHDEPAAVTQQAIVCPHCGKPMKIEVKG